MSERAPVRSVQGYGFDIEPVVHVTHKHCPAQTPSARMPFPIPLTGTMTVNGSPEQMYAGTCPSCGAYVVVSETWPK